jgi:hypothetical protein
MYKSKDIEPKAKKQALTQVGKASQEEKKEKGKKPTTP